MEYGNSEGRFQTAEEMQQAILAGDRAASNATLYPGMVMPTTKASTVMMQREVSSEAASPRETLTSAKTTFEREILPVVLDIGLSISQAIKAQSAKAKVNQNKADVMWQPPASNNPRRIEFAQSKFAPAPSSFRTPTGAPMYESWSSRLFRGMGEVFAALMTFIYHLLGLVSGVISLILMARFFLTFFHLSLGAFSSWVNALSGPLVAPFGSLLVLYHASSTTAYTIDVSTVIAFFVFAIGFGLIRGLFKPFRDKLKRSGMEA